MLCRDYLLHEAVAPAATGVILLELDEFELAERLEHSLEVVLCDGEMNVAHIEAVKRNTVGLGRIALVGVTRLTVLLGLGELSNDWNAQQLLTRELDGLGDRLLILEFDVTDAADIVSQVTLSV
jgi:hypothetical protein